MGIGVRCRGPGATRVRLELGGGDDLVDGRGGGDYVRGNPGRDVLFGGAEFDFMIGDEGADELHGVGGFDQLCGDGDDDILVGRDQACDQFSCGAGTDVARVDAGGIDLVDRSCERVRLPAEDPPELRLDE